MSKLVVNGAKLRCSEELSPSTLTVRRALLQVRGNLAGGLLPEHGDEGAVWSRAG